MAAARGIDGSATELRFAADLMRDYDVESLIGRKGVARYACSRARSHERDDLTGKRSGDWWVAPSADWRSGAR